MQIDFFQCSLLVFSQIFSFDSKLNPTPPQILSSELFCTAVFFVQQDLTLSEFVFGKLSSWLRGSWFANAPESSCCATPSLSAACVREKTILHCHFDERSPRRGEGCISNFVGVPSKIFFCTLCSQSASKNYIKRVGAKQGLPHKSAKKLAQKLTT